MQKIDVQGITVSVKKECASEFISLTDIAKYKNAEAPADVIKKLVKKQGYH